MNWFQRFFTNPNNHAIIAGVANAAQVAAIATGHPEVSMAIAAVGTAAGFQAAGTPETPTVPIPGHAVGGPVITLPPAAGGGAYHATDWLNLAASIANQFSAAAPARQ